MSKMEMIQFSLDTTFPKKDKPENYHRSLGIFIELFSTVEGVLNNVAVKYSQLSWSRAKALFLPLRIDAATQTVHRLLAERKLKGHEIERLKDVLQQLGQIARARNDIVHIGASTRASRDGSRIVTNQVYARSREQVRRTRISVDIINKMSTDLMLMILLLLPHASVETFRGKKMAPLGQLLVLSGRVSPLGKPVAWSYKSQPRAARRKKPRARPQARQPRPGSSSA